MKRSSARRPPERCDRQGPLRHTQAVPRLQQFFLVLRRPFQDHGADPARRIALNDPQRRDAHHQFAVLIDGMEVRHERADEHDSDHNAVEF